jgi:hypothetical protein
MMGWGYSLCPWDPFRLPVSLEFFQLIDSALGAFAFPTANRYHLGSRMPLYDKWPPRQS